MVRLYALLFVVQVILAVVALISCLSAEADDIRALPRTAWVMIILFFPLVGSIAWFLAGRPVPSGGATAGPLPGPTFRPRERPRPAAPDDDPDFLRSISAAQAKKDREMFDRWEEDLHRREEDLRLRDGADPQDGATGHPGDRAAEPTTDPTTDGGPDRQKRTEGREEQRPEA